MTIPVMTIPELTRCPVVFEPDGHHYYYQGRELSGITSTLIPCAYPDTYRRPEGFTEEAWQTCLADAAERGTRIHEVVEAYDEWGAMTGDPELRSYISIKERNGLTALASEYIVSDLERFATAIDKVFLDADGEVVIADIKHTSVLHHEEVTLQLSICRRLFEMQNPGIKVKGCYVLWLRGDKYRFRECTPWPDADLDALVDTFLSGQRYSIERRGGTLQATFDRVQDEIIRLELEAKEAAARQKELKEGLYRLMTEAHVKTFGNDHLQLTVVPDSETATIDTARLKEEHPELVRQYTKTAHRRGYLKLTIK